MRNDLEVHEDEESRRLLSANRTCVPTVKNRSLSFRAIVSRAARALHGLKVEYNFTDLLVVGLCCVCISYSQNIVLIS